MICILIIALKLKFDTLGTLPVLEPMTLLTSTLPSMSNTNTKSSLASNFLSTSTVTEILTNSFLDTFNSQFEHSIYIYYHIKSLLGLSGATMGIG